ncbi:MAG TPA: tetratricopeptide repeat protein [Myxococcaceae bacterium]|nr:tetratricopeptide repeat protein [Myxococcaceae bacterium]
MHARTLGPLAISLFLVAAAPAPSPDAQAAFDRGERALAEGRLDQAVAAYKEALSKSPGYAAALNGLGLTLFKQDKKPEAIQQFKAATEANPSFALAWSNLGFASRKMGDGAAAVAAYEKYVQLAPDDADGLYGLAESYRMAGDSAKAIPAYEQYIAKEKRPSEQKWVQKAKDQIAALKAPAAGPSATATAATPPVSDRPVSSPVLTPQLPTAGLPPGGTAAPALAQQRIAEGDAMMKASRYREATFTYQDAVNADPGNTEALFKLARAFATLGYFQQAVEKWNQVISLTQDPAIRKSCQDNITRAQAKIAEAGGSSPQAQGMAPGSGPIAESTREKARQHYEQGVLQINNKDYQGALASLTQTIQLEPTLAIAYVARGSANIGLRRFAQAAADYQYALKLDGKLASPLYGLGEAYRGLGRPLEARGWYEKYIASQGSDAREDLRSEARQKLQKL